MFLMGKGGRSVYFQKEKGDGETDACKSEEEDGVLVNLFLEC